MTSGLEDRINTCEKLRKETANVIAEILAEDKNISEIGFRNKLLEKLKNNKNIHERGWYEPPAFGIAVLFADAENPSRLLFDNLRKEEFWPKEENFFDKNGIGIVYASPVDKRTGIIGDLGLTIYGGKNLQIQNHIKNCLDVLEKVVEFIKIEMEFKEIHAFAQKTLEENKLNNNRTLTYTDKIGTNIGHTVPWSYEYPQPMEEKIIQSGNISDIKNLISSKRVHISSKESFKVLPTIAFTVEIRAESNDNPSLPNVFFHFIVCFKNGKKKILGNFNSVFEALGMNFIKSKY